jgi:hypothetical protein
MFHTAPLLLALEADRRREFARVARDRQLLDVDQPTVSETNRPSTAARESARPVVAPRTAPSGPACETL